MKINPTPDQRTPEHPNTEHRTPNTEHRPPSLVGVDTGGTFTDMVVMGADGSLTVRKLPSTPHDPSQSVLTGIEECLAAGLAAEGFDVVHGTTVATNALLQRRGVSTALITTQGFRDVLEIGRQTRLHLYAFHPTKPIPLLARPDRYELCERVDWQGHVLTPLDEEQAGRVLDALKAQGYESLAVCFLFSYLNPIHERMVERLANERGLAVSLSCDIAPEPREYERTSTTVANAFVAPLMERYLTNLETQLQTRGVNHLRVMQSNGGALSAKEAGHRAIATALSGPAGGVVAAARTGIAAGFPDLLTFDMGGTSTDVALILDGQCAVVTNAILGDMPLWTPMLDIHTVGAGGGSLARIDRAGGLRVGPQSAGADPGPVAYGRGETLTVTDANVLLGRLPDNVRLGGRVPLDGARVRALFAAFATQLGCTPEQAAQGILDVADATMTRALRHVSVERGHDPSRLTLLSFGGAGGLHACALATSLGMTRILIPRFPGAFSALGLALADTRREYVRALPPQSLNPNDLEALALVLTPTLNALHGQATQGMAREGFGGETWQAEVSLDMRYVGQSFTLRVPLSTLLPTRASAPADFPSDSPAEATQNVDVTGSSPLTPRDIVGALTNGASAFHALHRQRFGHADPREPIEVTAARLVTIGKREKGKEEDGRRKTEGETRRQGDKETGDGRRVIDNPQSSIHNPQSPTINHQPGVHRLAGRTSTINCPVYLNGGWQEVALYQREELTVGQAFSGPALVLQEDATTYIAPGWQTRIDSQTNMLLSR